MIIDWPINRKYILIGLCFMLLFFTQINHASASYSYYVDFETYPSGSPTSHLDPVDTQYSAWGIAHMTSLEYIPADDSFSIVTPVIGQYSVPWLHYPSGISALAPWPGDDTYYGTAQSPIEIYFDTPINYFSIYAMDVGYNGLLVEAFGADSSMLSYVSIDGTGREHNGEPGGDGLDFIEFSDWGITSLRVSQIHDPDWDRDHGLGLEGYLLDDMHYTVVPEPISSVLFITGGAFLAGRHFRRRKPASKN